MSILRHSLHSVCCCSRDSRAGVAHAGWDWHHIQHRGTLSKTSCASSVGLVTSCRKPVPGSIFTWGNSRQQTCTKNAMLCVCATFCQAMALCSQVREGKVSKTNFFSFLVLVQKQRYFRFFFFLFYMDSREKRTPVKVETIRAEFLCSCFIETNSFSCSSLRHKHTPSILQAVSNLFH